MIVQNDRTVEIFLKRNTKLDQGYLKAVLLNFILINVILMHWIPCFRFVFLYKSNNITGQDG